MKFLKNKSILISHKRFLNILKSTLTDIPIPNKSITQFVLEHSDKWNDKPAFTCGITGQSYTYGDIKKRTVNFSRSLIHNVGMQRGKVIGLILPNIPEYPIALHGAMEAGITVTSVNPLYTEGELKRQFVNAEAECLITIPKLKDVADKIGSHLPGYKGTITVGEGGQWDLLDLSDPNRTFEPLSTSPNAHDMALLPYSSGTTGLPKGVQLTHSNCVANIQQIMHPKFLDLQPASDSHQDIAVGVIPFFHIYGCTALLCVTMKFGMHTITLPNFTPESYVKCLEKYKPTALFLVPTLMMFLAKHPSVKREHLSSVKAVMCGAAPATKALIDLFKEKAGKSDITVQQGYGMTESSPCTLITPYDMPESKIGSAGILVPNTEAKVVCMTTGKDLPPNNQGELYVRGPQVMSGYLKNDEATKEALDSDKWLHTGDVAYYDDEGYFFITNRTKELIKVKGNQVSPTELESILMTLPGVEEVAVIGIPDEKSGEVPRAFVVCQKGVKLNETDIQEFIRPKVAPYKRLAGGVQFISAIPKNPTGKILRHELKAMSSK